MKANWKPIEEPPEVGPSGSVRCTLFGVRDDCWNPVKLIYATREDHAGQMGIHCVWEVDGDEVEGLYPDVTWTHWDFEPEPPEHHTSPGFFSSL